MLRFCIFAAEKSCVRIQSACQQCVTLSKATLTCAMQEELTSLSAQLQQLRDQFGLKTTEQLELKAKADLMERRLTAASKLIVGLSSERTRWTADMQVTP